LVLELSKSKSARKIAYEFGVGKTQIQNILKRKAKVLEDVENNVSGKENAKNISFSMLFLQINMYTQFIYNK